MRLPPGFGPTPKNIGAGPRPLAHAPGESHNASVETIKEGDKVVRLIVTCGCGERVEIECLYNAGH
jgi:hypothetical protein